MSNPRVRKLRKFEEKTLKKASIQSLQFKQFVIKGYIWGEENKKCAFLIHGWEGQTGNFGALVEILLNKGYRIVAFDAPSHGKSTKADTNMFDYGEFLTGIIPKYNPSLIISHSYGAVSSFYTLLNNPKIIINQWFMVTTPFDFKDRIHQIKDLIGVSSRTVMHLIRIMEQSTGYAIDELNMEVMAPKLKNIGELIIIHSKSDKVIPIEDARKTHKAFAGSELIEIDNVGHYAILWSEQLKNILRNRLN